MSEPWPVTTLQLRAISDAYRAWVDAQRTWNNGDEEFETLVALLDALAEEER